VAPITTLTRAAVSIRSPQSRGFIPGALAPGELPVRGVLSGLSAPVASGILPASAWPAADAAVAAAWKLVATADASIPKDSPQRGGIATMKLVAQRQSETLEKLKHDPYYGPRNPTGSSFSTDQQAIDAWKVWYDPTNPESFYAWAQKLQMENDFNSVWSMLKYVGAASAKDAADLAAQAGQGWKRVFVYLPYIAVGSAVLLGGLFVWRFAKGASKAAVVAADNLTRREVQAPVAGYSRRRRRRRSRR
jgi:hypothetical protein